MDFVTHIHWATKGSEIAVRKQCLNMVTLYTANAASEWQQLLGIVASACWPDTALCLR